jgi:clan AA aspartic protease
MNGRVDNSGRALISVELEPNGPGASQIEFWIDTGFTGELVISERLVSRLGLIQSGSVDAMLADGRQSVLPTYTCEIAWFGKVRRLEVVANDGDVPLLGVGLLLGKELKIDYTNLVLSLLPSGRKI